MVFALLFSQGIMTEEEYGKRLDELFLDNPENDDLLYLEWETDIKEAINYIRLHIDDTTVDYELFGRILMKRLKEYYKEQPDINLFAQHVYNLWESLPGHIQDREPFWTLSYADDPLSWGDEEQTRKIYEDMMRYYSGGDFYDKYG